MPAIKGKNNLAQVTPEKVTPDREIVTSRVFDAPREVVWDAFTDPKQVALWWGPRGFTTTIHEMDVRPGGCWRHTMRGPDGTNYPNASIFQEVVRPERIVYSHGGGKEGGQGASFIATWTFEAQGEKTLMTGRMVFAEAAARELVVREYGAIEGAVQTFDRLAEHLKAKHVKAIAAAGPSEATPVILERTYGAPTDVVWKSHHRTRPDEAVVYAGAGILRAESRF
jgi:uncharacterized protein YndB with AHSA1/START domain